MGMYTECQKALIDALRKTGYRNTYTSKKRLTASAESRVSAVLCETEVLEKAKKRTLYTTEEKKKMRSKRYQREIIFTVVLGDYSQEDAEKSYEAFLLQLPSGFYDADGNYVAIEPEESQWMEEKDHILYAKVAVQLKIVCRGGVYQDTDMVRIKDADINVSKEIML